jgi:hypothetical protein
VAQKVHQGHNSANTRIVMRQLASSDKALPLMLTHIPTLTGFAHAPANRKLPHRTSDTSQPHNTKYNQCLSEDFIGRFSEKKIKT